MSLYECEVTKQHGKVPSDALGEIATSFARLNTGIAADEEAVLDGPITAKTSLSDASRWAAATASFGWP